MSNEKDRSYEFTLTLEVKVTATSEQLALEHAEQMLDEGVSPFEFGKVVSWDVS